MLISAALINAVKCFIRVFFLYKPDWVKYFDSSTGLGSDQITERKFWTGLGVQKSPICSTLQSTTGVQIRDDWIAFFYYPILSCFLKMISASDPVLVEIILSVSENYPKVYCDAQHTFLCVVYFAA